MTLIIPLEAIIFHLLNYLINPFITTESIFNHHLYKSGGPLAPSAANTNQMETTDPSSGNKPRFEIKKVNVNYYSKITKYLKCL